MEKRIRYSFYNFKKIYPNLTEEELKVMDYFLQNVSVGEIIAVRELERIYFIKNPVTIIESLIQKGLLERGNGCFNLSKELKKKLASKQ